LRRLEERAVFEPEVHTSCEGVRCRASSEPVGEGSNREFCQEQVVEEGRVEVELGHEVTVAESQVELECKEDKKSGERERDWTTEPRGVMWNHVAKSHKFVEQEVIVARSGCIV
jgi:hypothetical protein